MTTLHVPADDPAVVVPMSNDQMVLVLDPDADEIGRTGEINEIVRNPDARSG